MAIGHAADRFPPRRRQADAGIPKEERRASNRPAAAWVVVAVDSRLMGFPNPRTAGLASPRTEADIAAGPRRCARHCPPTACSSSMSRRMGAFLCIRRGRGARRALSTPKPESRFLGCPRRRTCMTRGRLRVNTGSGWKRKTRSLPSGRSGRLPNSTELFRDGARVQNDFGGGRRPDQARNRITRRTPTIRPATNAVRCGGHARNDRRALPSAPDRSYSWAGTSSGSRSAFLNTISRTPNHHLHTARSLSEATSGLNQSLSPSWFFPSETVTSPARD